MELNYAGDEDERLILVYSVVNLWGILYPVVSLWGPVKCETSLDQLSDSVGWSLLSLRLGYVEMERLNEASFLLLAIRLLEICTYEVGPN
jgi:hypothetical protein